MNMKYLVAAPAFALVLASAVQAADVAVSQEAMSVTSSVPVVSSAFSWAGFYFGGHFGGLSGKTERSFDGIADLFEDSSIKLPIFYGGFYAGSNVDFGNNLVAGFDVDFIGFGRNGEENNQRPVIIIDEGEAQGIKDVAKAFNVKVSEEKEIEENDVRYSAFNLKEKWAGAARMRVGFSSDRIMPYIAGGLAYAHFNNVATLKVTKSPTGEVLIDGKLADETKTMVGYTLGAGVDFAVTDNVVLRTEYRYSDYGKKKFMNEKFRFGYKTNDFRVGIAYKF